MINQKMKSFKFTDLNENRSSKGSCKSDKLISMTVTTGGKSVNDKYRILHFSFHERIKRLTGIKTGDTLNFEYNNGVICLFKDQLGRKLACPARKTGDRDRVRFAIPKEYIGFFDGEATEIETEEGRICFKVV